MTELWPDLPVEERLARKFRMEAAREDPVERVQPVVLESGPIDVPELPKPIRDIAELLPSVEARHAQTFAEGAVFKTGPKAGQKRPDKTIDHYSIAHRGKDPLTAVWSDGKLQYAKAFRAGQWLLTDKVTVLKKWIKEEQGE